MKASLKKKIAREWLIIIFSIIVGFPLLILILSIVSSVINPTDKWRETYLAAWWNRVSQGELATIMNKDFENASVGLREEIKEAIANFRDNYEKSKRFIQLSFFEKYQWRNKYFTEISRERGLYLSSEKKLAEQIFQTLNMVYDIDYIKSANKWVEPSEGEDLNASRLGWAKMISSLEPELSRGTKLEKAKFTLKRRWNDLWRGVGEGLQESLGSVMLFALIPYFFSILLRSIVWAVKNK